MKILQNIPAAGNAGETLKEMGIDWDRMFRPSFKRYSCYTNRVIEEPGPITYFMKGDCDVAYFTMDFLFIHDEPRGPWSPEFLS